MMRIRAVMTAVACAAVLTGCSGGSDSNSVAGTNTSSAQVTALSAGASIPVNGILETLQFRRTCIRDAAGTICASLLPPGPKNPLDTLPALNLGEPVNGVVVKGKYAGHAKLLTWSFVTTS